MRRNDIEQVLRDALHQEVIEAAPFLGALQEQIVSELGERLPRLGFVGWLKQLTAPTRSGRWGQLVVVGATAALFLVFGILVSDRVSLSPSLRPAAPSLASNAQQEVLFVVPAMNADSVAVVGDFNAWEATPLLDDNQDGIWTATIPLPPGRYEYAFVIDGRWWGQDPLADEYVRSFGQYSSVRYVGGGGDGA